jgi:4-hydroxy-2-oxovalerate aldolase
MAQLQAPEILDCTLRDGSYVIDFQFTAEDTALIVSALDSAGIPLIEVAHGLGLGAARAGKGDQPCSDEAYLKAAADAVTDARFGAFFIPGIGSEEDLRLAADCGTHFVRIGTNITELDQAEPYVALARKLGLTVFCNLMKSYAVSAEQFAACGKQAKDYGADVLCLVDSAGGMLPEDVKNYLEAARAASDIRLDFHGHDNLSMGVANTLAAYEAGATVLDSSLQGLGRSEGNAVTEVVVAILQKRGLFEGIDVNGLLDISEAFIRNLAPQHRRSPIGITTGRAKFHSSFLGRVLTAAGSYGVDPRDLILRLCEHDQVNAPVELLESLAAELANKATGSRIRVDVAASPAEAPTDFNAQVHARAAELKEQGSKRGLPSVLNVVVTPYEVTAVSPYVETAFGCAMANVMLAEPARLSDVLEAADPLVNYVLLDAATIAIPDGALKMATLLPYSDQAMWARAAVTHVTALMEGDVQGAELAVTGFPELAMPAALRLQALGANVWLYAGLPDEDQMPTLLEIADKMDGVLSLSPRQPAVGAEVVAAMDTGSLLYDGGIGSLAEEAVSAAESRGIRVVRVDMRPTLAATALELIGARRIVKEHMGRATWGGVDVVAGGLIGHRDEVIVDSIGAPARVIGVADGKGGILAPDPQDDRVLRVRQAIAEMRLHKDN